MRLAVLTSAVVFSLLLCSGVALAQNIPPDLVVKLDRDGRGRSLPSRVAPAQSASLDVAIENGGGSIATFSNGQVILTADNTGAASVEGCQVRGTTDNRSIVYPAGTYPNVACRISNGIVRLVATGPVAIDINDYVSAEYVVNSPDDDGTVGRVYSADPAKTVTETDETNNVLRKDPAYVGTPPPTDLRVSHELEYYTIKNGIYQIYSENASDDNFNATQSVIVSNPSDVTAFGIDVQVESLKGFNPSDAYVSGNAGTCRVVSGYGALCQINEIPTNGKVTIGVFYASGAPNLKLGTFSSNAQAESEFRDLKPADNSSSIDYRIRNRPEAPVIAPIPTQNLKVNLSKAVKVRIKDSDAPASELRLYVIGASDKQLIPERNVRVSGTGSVRTVIIKPIKNRTGYGRIYIRTTDRDGLSDSNYIAVKVRKK